MGGALYLEPRLGSLESDRLLHTLADALGSPLGVVLPDQITENVERFRSVYRGHRLAGQIFTEVRGPHGRDVAQAVAGRQNVRGGGRRFLMATSAHAPHSDHAHQHGSGCGHVAVPHEDHIDYVHDGHIHRAHDDHADECESTGHTVHDGHDHRHHPDCGHVAVPHGDHVDYVHDGHRHAQHGDHWDDH